MKVIATKEFLGVPDGRVYPRLIAAGEELTGELAEVALRDGLAKQKKPARPAEGERDEAKPEGEAAA